MVERLDMVGEMGNKAKRIESTFTLMSNQSCRILLNYYIFSPEPDITLF